MMWTVPLVTIPRRGTIARFGFSNLLNLTNPTDLAVYYRMRYVAPPLPASAPTGLTATAYQYCGDLELDGSRLCEDLQRQELDSRAAGRTLTIANTIATAYTNTGLVNGTPYYYRRLRAELLR